MTSPSTDLARQRSEHGIRMAPVLLAAFLTAGIYKNVPFVRAIPGDITVDLAVLVLIAMATRVWRNGLRLDRRIWRLIAIFVSFLPAAAIPMNEYGIEKLSQVLSLGLIAVCAPVILLRSRVDVRWFFGGLATLGFLSTLLALSGYNRAGLYDRYAVLDATTIQTARITGICLIWLVIKMVGHEISVWRGVPPAVAVGLVMVGTGSRGPVLAALVAIAVTLSVRGLATRRRMARRVAAICCIGLLIVFSYHLAPAQSRSRLLTPGASGQERLDAYAATIELVPANPLGSGWGNWADLVGPDAAHENRYVHNLVLESFAEGGWIAGVAIVYLLATSLRAGLRLARRDTVGRLCFAFLIFMLVNSAFSDDLVSARLFFSSCGVVLGWRWAQTRLSRNEAVADRLELSTMSIESVKA